MGGYAIIRFLLPICSQSYNDYGQLCSTIGYLSITNTAFILLTEFDSKRLIAYFSILHMNISLIATFAVEKLVILGALGMMLSHSLISSGLFFCIGVLYERYQKRDISYYGGLIHTHSKLGELVFTLLLGNFAFPLTFSFWPEIVVLTGLGTYSFFEMCLILASSIFSMTSSLIFFTKIFFGISTYFILKYADVTSNEFYFLWSLSFYNFFYGIFPMSYFDMLQPPVNYLLTALSAIN